MATIVRNFEGKVIKNVGDSVIYYFPNTCDSSNECAFRNVLDCCLTMIAITLSLMLSYTRKHCHYEI